MLTRPEPHSGLEVLESENFRLQCFNTMTGTKFLLFTDTTQANVDLTIRRIYDMYSDYVMRRILSTSWRCRFDVTCSIGS